MTHFEQLDTETILVEEGIRLTIEKEPMTELVASIRQHGILQPIVVEPDNEVEVDRAGNLLIHVPAAFRE